jgi:hypothetical protein
MNEAEKPTYEQLEKMHKAAVESLQDMVEKNNSLEAVIAGQSRANVSLGQKDEQRQEMLQAQIGDHNRTVQEMGAEINRLRAKVVALGGNPDEEEVN